MKDLKETLDALSKHWRQWAKSLSLPYAVLAVAVAAVVTLALKTSLDIFFPMWEIWRATDNWDFAVALVPVSMLWLGLLAGAVGTMVATMWWAHIRMHRTVCAYPSKELVGKAFVVPALISGSLTAVVVLVMWLPTVVLFFSADAAASSLLIEDPVTTPVWVWVVCSLSAFVATFVCEIAVTLARLVFHRIPVADCQ